MYDSVSVYAVSTKTMALMFTFNVLYLYILSGTNTKTFIVYKRRYDDIQSNCGFSSVK